MGSTYGENNSVKKAFCPQCGHSVNEGDKFCPACGNELNAPREEYASFCLKREKKAFFCAAVYDVYLDHQMVCKLKNGERYNATLPVGQHYLELIDKKNFNTTVYSHSFVLNQPGLVLSFSAAMKVYMQGTSFPSGHVADQPVSRVFPVTSERNTFSNRQQQPAPARQGRRCPKCGGIMSIQVVEEQKKAGCGTILFYILLSITILGLLIVIPLLLRKKTVSKTYSVCQSCGYKQTV